MRKVLAAIALLLLSSAGYAAEQCATVVGWVGVPLCTSAVFVTVPDVVGDSLTDADTALEAVLLDTGAVSSRCSDELLDIVLSQRPAAGASAAEGSTVDLTASNGVACPPNRGRRIGLGLGL